MVAAISLGAVLTKTGDMDGAIASYQRAIAIITELDASRDNQFDTFIMSSDIPHGAMAYCQLGDALASRRDFVAAIAAYRSAIALAQTDVQCNLGKALASHGDLESSIVSFETDLSISPTDHFIANALYSLGQWIICQLF